MPCYDDYRGAEKIDDATRPLRDKVHKLEVMLCQVIRASHREDKQVFDHLLANWDEKEAGVSYREFRNWFNDHFKADARRKTRR